MPHMIETVNLSKRFESFEALAEVSLTVDRPNLVGLIGRNGSGKTTLLRHLVGLYLPSSGRCETLGSPAGELGPEQLSRIGWVPQEQRFLDWMTVDQHIEYVAAQYGGWDPERERRLREELELPGDRRVGALSSGEAQKLSLVLALGHRPELLLLDEPVSALDPISRARLLAYLLEMLAEQELTVVISSHVLRDIEKIVNRVVCLDRGRITADAEIDELQELYAEWRLVSANGRLPDRFEESWVIDQKIEEVQARLVVRGTPEEALELFQRRYRVEVEVAPMSLEELFPYLIGGGSSC